MNDIVALPEPCRHSTRVSMNNVRRTISPPRRSLCLCLIALPLFAGCTVGPDYRSPSVAVPVKWSTENPSAAGTKASVSEKELGRWWLVFHDPLLTSLEERALAANLDLKLAEARIQQARAARLGAGSTLGPSLESTAQYTHSRTLATSAQGNSVGTIGNQFQAGFDASWELDLFGRGRRTVEAADADLLASVEARHGAMVSLTAEVARTYLELRSLQQSIRTAKQNIAAQDQTTELTRQLFQAGFVNSLDVANAEAQAASQRAQVPPLESSVQQTMHSLAILLGQEPAALTQELTPVTAIPVDLPKVPAGLPSDLLRRRPDIRQAEAQIHAATARIGVAEADLFPRLTLSGALSLQGDALDSWFNWTRRLWSLGPSASWQLFDSGRIKANVLQQKSLTEQSLILYQQAVLTALQEVEDALVAATKEEEHHTALTKSQDANKRSLELANTLYRAGQTDFINVLQAERAVYATDDLLTQSTTSLATNLVALYKALGGGWEGAEK
jgi:multidrug efflux system outer membrane protein